MKLRDIFPLFVYIICLFACNSNKKTEPITQTQILATGQMPALAKDAGNNMHVVYGSGDSLMYCSLKNNGLSFSKPVFVAVVNNLVAGSTRGPQIAATKNGVAVIAVNRDGNIYAFVKNNFGQWMRTAKINDTEAADKEGFSALGSDGDKTLFAIWTDVRNNKHNKMYGAKSGDGGYTWSKNILVYASPDSSICECCKPSVAMNGHNIYVMFRNWLNGNRDVYLIQSDNAGNSFGAAQKLGKGSWKLNGCPMDGGGLVIAKDGIPNTVWRRQKEIYIAVPGNAEKKIGEGKGCSIESVNGKNVYAFSNVNGDIVCLLPGGSEINLGQGILPVLKSAANDKILCVWQHEEEIFYRLIKV